MSKKIHISALLSFNFILSSIIFLIYPFSITASPIEYVFLLPALFSSVLLIYIAILPVVYLLTKIPKISFWAIVSFFSIFHSIALIDTAIFHIYKFHINSMVINLLITPGGLATLDQTLTMKIFYVITFILIVTLSMATVRLSLREKKKLFHFLFVFSLFCLVFEKALAAWSVSTDYAPFSSNFKVYPFYQPLKMRAFLEKNFNIKPERNEKVTIRKYSRLKYPIRPIEMKEISKKPNIVIIVIDSLRFDMFTKEIMPNSYMFAKNNKASVFLNHYSGGNATRFGIFSIFYGIYGNYWEKILGERRSPVLIDTLNKLGYEIGVFASARVTYPEFDRTCFVSVPYSKIFDRPPGNKVEKDYAITKAAIDFIEKKYNKPFFAFVFYDALHGSYDYPKEMEKFSGASKGVNQIFLRPSNVYSAFLRYKNSAYFEDFLAGKILDIIRDKKLISNTVVIVTGDHGEPFFERGYYGHNQAYCDYEIKPPLLLYVPGKKMVKTSFATSHMDIVPTLMSELGVKNSQEDFSNGLNLYDEKALASRKFVSVFSWDTAAIVTAKETIVLPLESYKMQDLKFYDSSYNPIKKEKKGEYSLFLKDFLYQSSRFYE